MKIKKNNPYRLVSEEARENIENRKNFPGYMHYLGRAGDEVIIFQRMILLPKILYVLDTEGYFDTGD